VFVLRVMIFVILLLQPAASAAEKILALQGGGIRALSSDAGLIAGVARVSQLSRNGVEKGAFDRLDSVNVTAMLQGFDSVSSVSGSSWFAAEFFFSSSFVEMLAGIASSPSTAAQQFDEQWIRPWLLATDVQEPRFDSFQVLVRLWVKLLLGTGDEDTIFLAQFFLATGFTWNHFVDVLLMSTGGISNSTLMGSPPTPGAHQKWLVDHTVVLPASGACIRQGRLIFPRVTYGAVSNEELPVYLPAKFSVRLGSGINSSAPFPYISIPEVPIQFKFQGLCIGCGSTSSAPTYQDTANGTLISSSGTLPVVQTVAASSAVFGSAIDSFVFSEIAAEISADVAVWLGVEGFHAADELHESVQSHVDGLAMSQLAGTAFHALIDGGYTDGTGIAQAVSSGASEVVVVLNSFSINQAEYVLQLFPGGPIVKPGVPKELFPVFQSPNASVIEAAFAEFQTLKLASGSRFLKVLAIGTIEGTTAENKFFGIAGGSRVTINVINICSELSIGFFANFDNYGQLVQEVALTVSDPANRDMVLTKLMPFFGSTFASFPGTHARPVIQSHFI